MKKCKHPDGCDGQMLAKGWCSMHYQRVRIHGDPGPAGRMPPGYAVGDAPSDYGEWRMGTGGYMVRRVRKGTDRYRIHQHREVMERLLGRPLREFENVHHKNGIRHDNRPENLELWCTPQPYGQRAIDLATWVVESYPELVEKARLMIEEEWSDAEGDPPRHS